MLYTCLGVLALVLAGSLYKIYTLKSGGKSIAKLLGGELVDPHTDNFNERQLLNVVEEMAIASGTPVPSVYLLRREMGINAFAAGFTPSDAVIGITQGCLNSLTRDELQGVIAHEFSHILNGDMRLNLKLIGMIHGILIIGLIGLTLIKSGTTPHRRRHRDKESAGASLIFIIVGVLIYAIGYIGVFFGKLIKAAVSRRRKFLADASAVQFTRYGQGLTGALKKIGGASTGSIVRCPNAEQASHIFFGNAVSGIAMRGLATHPSLNERILRIDPSFDGTFTEVQVDAPLPETTIEMGTFEIAATAVATAVGSQRVRINKTIETIGAPGRTHLEFAAKIKAMIPTEIVNAAHNPHQACAVIYCLLLDHQRKPREPQIEYLKQQKDQTLLDQIRTLAKPILKLPLACRLPLVDMTLPALRQLSQEQYQQFKSRHRHLIKADQRLSLFEYVLQRLLLRHLEPHFNQVTQPIAKYYAIKPLTDEVETLISILAHMGHQDADQAKRAFTLVRDTLRLEMSLQASKDISFKRLNFALDKLNQASPAIKKRVLEACVICMAADGETSLKEAELLRAIADALDCPVPPFLPGQKLSAFNRDRGGTSRSPSSHTTGHTDHVPRRFS